MLPYALREGREGRVRADKNPTSGFLRQTLVPPSPPSLRACDLFSSSSPERTIIYIAHVGNWAREAR